MYSNSYLSKIKFDLDLLGEPSKLKMSRIVEKVQKGEGWGSAPKSKSKYMAYIQGDS